MSLSLVVMVIGDDRPGLVETVSRTITGHGANWLESRMARLGGKFAGILRVEVPEGRAEALRDALAGLGAAGLRVIAEPSRDAGETGGERPRQAPLVRLELVGADHAGIVRDVARTLAAHNVNVEELETELSEAPMSGDALFRASARLRLPPGGDLEALRRGLEKIAGDLMVDIRLVDREPAA